MPLTRNQAMIIARMRELVQEGGWAVVPGHIPTIRISRELTTPNYAREPFRGRVLWDQPTYTEHLFVTLAGDKLILGHGSCPWVGRSDSYEPHWYVNQLLNAEDPWDVLSRRIELKAARKAARS